MTIEIIPPGGDLFLSNSQTLVNPINCVGVMGAGLALAFKKKFPALFKDYVEHCVNHQGTLFSPYLYHVNDKLSILNFPTKLHWNQPSKMDYLTTGLQYLDSHYKEWNLTSLAVPMLGCGLGGLPHDEVLSLMCAVFGPWQIPVQIFQS